MSQQSQLQVDPCPICLDYPMVLPIKYQCNHTFCFLCIKQHTQSSYNEPKCPLCRQVLDLDHYQIIRDQNPNHPTSNYYWQYQGRNFGWWNYTQQMSQKIENTYRQHRLNQLAQQNADEDADEDFQSCDSDSDSNLTDTQCSLEIGSSVYIVDIENMIQYHRDHPDTQKRNIRRVTDLDKQETKGTAGLQNYYDE